MMHRMLFEPEHPHTNYLQKLYRCMLYLRKDYMRTSLDDAILYEELHMHIVGVVPVPRTQLGVKLLTNGSIVVAYAVMLSRLYKSPLLLGYILSYIDNLIQL